MTTDAEIYAKDRKLAVIGFTVASLASSPALTNGRFPRAERLLENPRDPNQLILSATYSLLVSSDRGQN